MDFAEEQSRRLQQQRKLEVEAEEHERELRRFHEFDQSCPGQHEEGKDAWLARIEQKKKEQEEYNKAHDIGE